MKRMKINSNKMIMFPLYIKKVHPLTKKNVFEPHGCFKPLSINEGIHDLLIQFG